MTHDEHNPGEPEFGEHADDAPHNPGEPEFDPAERPGGKPREATDPSTFSPERAPDDAGA